MEAADSLVDEDKRVVLLGDTPVSIGRASDRVLERTAKTSNLYLTNSHISKEHARLLLQNDEVLIEDLNSSFGTVKNDDLLIPFNRMPLKEGDILGFVLNRSLSYISTMRNNRGLSKTVPLSMFSKPKIQVEFKVTKIDINSRSIVLERLSCESLAHGALTKEYVLTGDSPNTISNEDAADKNELSSMSFSNLLNSDSCQCTDVSDSNGPQCGADTSSCQVRGEDQKESFQFTDSEAESTMSESEASNLHADEDSLQNASDDDSAVSDDSESQVSDSASHVSDDESEILVNLGPDSDFDEDKSEVLVNLIEFDNDHSDDTKIGDSEFSCQDTLLSAVYSEDEKIYDEQEEEEEEEELSENESDSDEEVIDFSEEDVDQASFARGEIAPNLVVDQVWEKKLAWCPVETQEVLSAEVTFSRKRRHEEVEFSMESALAPPAKKKRLNGILWEVGKGAMYVTGTLMALVAYGGYLVNNKM